MDTEKFINYTRSNNVEKILDVGANCGDFTRLSLTALECSPESNRVVAVEADKSHEEALKAIGVPYFMEVLYSERKEKIFYKAKQGYGSGTGNSLFRELTDFYSEEHVVKEKVTTKTLDELFLHTYPSVFDFIKLDVEGAELEILKGGSGLLRRGVRHVLMEVACCEDDPYNLDAPQEIEVLHYMSSIGFKKIDCLEEHIHKGVVHKKDYLFKLTED
tara:strand:+ start:430 stop:1080 length:651 start_codon:yes stop_codon:yes gene_type:complete